MGWRNCAASVTLVDGINLKWPGRDKSSDGTIGDAAHASRSSDHNPWVVVAGMGVVRARDVDKDGIDAAFRVEELRKAGKAGDPRLAGGGYVIFNRRITKPDFSRWAVYTGSNPHDKHFHVSFSQNVAGFDSQAGWAFLGGARPVPAVVPTRVTQVPDLKFGMRANPYVASLQRFLNAEPWAPALPLLPVTGNYLEMTRDVIKAAQRQAGVTGSDADGTIVGPRTRQAFIVRGWRP
jgi:hypothetical protein